MAPLVRFRADTLILLPLVAAVAVRAEDEAGEPKKDSRWQEIYRQQASGYEFATAGARRQELELRPQPVMQWVSLNDYDGDVFVWTLEGRPEVVGTVFSSPGGAPGRRRLMHEFYSFAAEPIEATGLEGRSFSFKRGVELKPIPGAPAPADNPTRRRLQARALAREFSAHMKRQDERWELRLLNHPLYSYNETSDGVLGGAVFAFVGFVTDPEILLLVEARETPDGPQWVYAAARFSNKSLWLLHKESEVWQYLEGTPSPDVPYYITSAPAVTVPADQ